MNHKECVRYKLTKNPYTQAEIGKCELPCSKHGTFLCCFECNDTTCMNKCIKPMTEEELYKNKTER